jgi:hypothetical protein
MKKVLSLRMNSLTLMVLYTKDRLKMVTSDMVMEFKYGQMVVNTKATGKMELLQAEESSTISTTIFMMVRYATNNIFKGNWENDKANGYGIYYHSNGSRYEGNWVNDK